MNHPAPLIHRPERQQRLARRLWQLVTALCWAAYLYLWLPLFTLLLWFLGIEIAVYELYQRRDQVDPFVLLTLPLLALFCGLLLIGWAEYNRLRFQGRERRQPRAHVGRREIAEVLGAGPAVADAMVVHKIQVLHMDEHARPVSTRALPAVRKPPAPASQRRLPAGEMTT